MLNFKNGSIYQEMIKILSKTTLSMHLYVHHILYSKYTTLLKHTNKLDKDVVFRNQLSLCFELVTDFNRSGSWMVDIEKNLVPAEALDR